MFIIWTWGLASHLVGFELTLPVWLPSELIRRSSRFKGCSCSLAYIYDPNLSHATFNQPIKLIERLEVQLSELEYYLLIAVASSIVRLANTRYDLLLCKVILSYFFSVPLVIQTAIFYCFTYVPPRTSGGSSMFCHTQTIEAAHEASAPTRLK